MPRAPILVAFVLASAGHAAGAQPAPADPISWVRADGGPGWTTPVARATLREGDAGRPLVAAAWLPRLPSLKLALARGGTFDLDATRGKVVLLDFWASWCGPCLAELPHLERLHTQREGDGLVAIAVNADEGPEVAAAAARRLGLTMTVALDDPALYGTFRVHTLPTLLLADRDGRVRARWDGYRPGLETTIAETAGRLIAGDREGTEQELARVLSGRELLRALWYRDFPGTVDGVAVLPPSAGKGRRVICASRGQIVAFDARGEATARIEAPSWVGRLLDFGADADGGAELASYRPGATTFGVVDVATGATREMTAPAPIVDLAAEAPGEGRPRRLLIATVEGAAVAGPRDAAAVRMALDGARNVTGRGARGALLLLRDGSLVSADEPGRPWPAKAGDGVRLLAAAESGAAVGPRTAIASAIGRFLPGGRSQLAVATYAGHVVLLDVDDGRLLFDAVWPDARDLAAGDLDGDGLDELLVADDRRIAALSSAPRAR